MGRAKRAAILMVGSLNLWSGRGLNDHICLSVYLLHTITALIASAFLQHSVQWLPLHRAMTMSHHQQHGHDYRLGSGQSLCRGHSCGGRRPGSGCALAARQRLCSRQRTDSGHRFTAWMRQWSRNSCGGRRPGSGCALAARQRLCSRHRCGWQRTDSVIFHHFIMAVNH